MEVEDVLLPVRLPGTELDDELWWVVMAAAVELAVSVSFVIPWIRDRN
jgi:hypothetical protein